MPSVVGQHSRIFRYRWIRRHTASREPALFETARLLERPPASLQHPLDC